MVTFSCNFLSYKIFKRFKYADNAVAHQFAGLDMRLMDSIAFGFTHNNGISTHALMMKVLIFLLMNMEEADLIIIEKFLFWDIE